MNMDRIASPGSARCWRERLIMALPVSLAVSRAIHGRGPGTLLALVIVSVGTLVAPVEAEAAPEFKLTSKTQVLDLPDGCFYGEAIRGSFEVCNVGDEDAVGFIPGILLGAGLGVNLGFDAAAATSPQACFEQGTIGYVPCADEESTCVNGYCRKSCTTAAACGEGEVCEEGICEKFLAAGACTSYRVEGRIPEVDGYLDPYIDEDRRFYFLADSTNTLGGLYPAWFGTVPELCRRILPDFGVASLRTPAGWVAGEPVTITRRIMNYGFIERPGPGIDPPPSVDVEVRYVLVPTTDLSTAQIPLEGGGVITLTRKGSEVRTETIVTPWWIAPGRYYLGVLIDPHGEVTELSKERNGYVHPDPVVVSAAALRILTGALPVLTLGSHPRIALIAQGGLGHLRWSAEGLPPGLELDEDGTLHGSPTEEGTFLATVRVESANDWIERPLAIAVAAPIGPLEISTTSLPVAVRGQPYDGVRLAANGGEPPYRWSLAPTSAELPAGLEGPTEDGRFAGKAVPFATGAEIVAVVEDSRGNRASRRLTLKVKSGTDLRISSRTFADGVMGARYVGNCAQAAGGSSEAELHWEIDETLLPTGLSAEAEGRTLCLRGTPESCGLFQLRLMVADGNGGVDEAELPLSIGCEALLLRERSFVGLKQGEEVELHLVSIPETATRYRLRGGELPKGLSLMEGGVIEGTVSPTAQGGAHNLIVELRDEAGRFGLSPLTLRVDPPEAPPPPTEEIRTSGCSIAEGSLSLGALWGMLGGVWLLARARRSRAAGVEGSSRRCVRSGGSSEEGQRRGERVGAFGPAAGVVLAIASAFAVLSCGDSVEVRTVDRCEEVVCDEDLECDPKDGICKCGGASGVPCEEGERCSIAPEPLCVSIRCEGVVCERGESCDSLSGNCLCGTRSCEEGERCLAGECVRASLCADVRCAGGMQCDEADGQCRCGDEVCSAEERCVDGGCVFDRCAGVSCGVHGRCDPVDGQCHCGGFGGPICQGGEACVYEGAHFSCVQSDRCLGVDCGGGTVCDPADGQCRCDGLGAAFPICGSDQTCYEGQCLGGRLCEKDGEPIVCREDLSCDPGTGACSCGGKGGEICGEDERCQWTTEGPRCVQSCKLLRSPSGCAQGEACYIDHSATNIGPICQKAGRLLGGSHCDSSFDCVEGLYCSLENRCRFLCEMDTSDCGSISKLHTCKSLDTVGTEGIGYCVQF